MKAHSVLVATVLCYSVRPTVRTVEEVLFLGTRFFFCLTGVPQLAWRVVFRIFDRDRERDGGG